MATQTLNCTSQAAKDQETLNAFIGSVENPSQTWTATTSEKQKIAADPMRGFSGLGDFLTAVKESTGRRVAIDRRLEIIRELSPVGKQLAAGSDEAGIYSDPYGGFLVPVGLSPTSLSLQPEFDPTIGRTQDIPMSTLEMTIPARVDSDHSGGNFAGTVSVQRTKETQSATASRMEVMSLTLRAANLYGFAYVTEELVNASRDAFVALLTRSFNEGFSSTFLKEKIGGGGAGEFTGVLEAGALVEIAKETNQPADTFLYENAIKMRMRCWGYDRAIWFSNPNCTELLGNLISPSGNHAYHFSEREGEPDTLLGRPIFYTEHCSTLGDRGDLVLCSWPEYVVGRLREFETAESVHVRYLNHERAFRFSIASDGAPWWKQALTPANGADTLSPYVTLAERA